MSVLTVAIAIAQPIPILAIEAFAAESMEAPGAEAADPTRLEEQAQDATAIGTVDGIEEATAPRPAIEAFHGELIQIMKEAKTIGFQGRVDRMTPLLAEIFDLEFMASKTVGGHWRKLSEADKMRWIQLFARITVCNYAGRFTGYTGEKFITTDVQEANRGQRVVLTKIILPEDEDVQLNYRLHLTDTGWRIIDVYLNGTVSELALRRSEYSAALKREGFEELIANIETKIEDLKAKGLVDG